MVINFTEMELVIWFKLCNVKGLGPVKLIKLYSIFKTLENIYGVSDAELLKTRIFNEDKLVKWNKLKSASNENFIRAIRECQKTNIRILPLVSTNYPKQLLNIPYPPTTLFLKGNLDLLNSELVAIVGTREASDAALEWTFETSKELSNSGFTIISGGASGVDTEAHKGALTVSEGKTVCVLGTGLLKPFPEENLSLFDEISERGLMISEHLPNFTGSRFALIQRNRITSGLALAVILCASRLYGGAMVQTKIANEQRKNILMPHINLNLLPNEGLKFAKEKYGAIEIKNGKDAVKFLEKLKRDELVQKKLNFS